MKKITLRELKVVNNKLDILFDSLDKNDIVLFSGGFYCYEKFPVSMVLKSLLKTIISNNDYVFDYSEERLEKFAKDAISEYYNIDYNWNIDSENVFLSAGTFGGFIVLKKVFDELFGMNSKKILVITPNYMRGLEILCNDDDVLYFCDNLEILEKIAKYDDVFFDLCIFENPFYPQGYFLNQKQIEVLQIKSKYMVIDGSINSYNYIKNSKFLLPSNAIFCMSISKEFGITFKGGIITKNRSVLDKLEYVHSLFGFSTLLYVPIIGVIYLHKIFNIKSKKYLDIISNHGEIIKQFGIGNFLKNEVQELLMMELNKNYNNFLSRKELLNHILKEHLENKKIKIYENQAGINILLGISKKISYEEMIENMVKYKFDLMPLYFYFLNMKKYDYHLFKMNISGQTDKGFILGLKRLNTFLNEL